MSDESDKRDEMPPDEESRGPLAGERLAEARRAQQIPAIEIAKELHLDEYKVRALESNDFDVIGAPVFAKGHLRKYAQLVKVDEADVMADYYQLNRSTGTPPVLLTRSKPRQFVALGPWVAVIIVILVVASAYWWFAAREPAAPPPVTGAIAPLPSQPEVLDEPVSNGPEEAEDAAVDEPIVSVEPDPVEAEVVATDSPGMRLSITYLGDCWTEITDASGRRLYFDLGEEGRTVNLSGEAPFNVLFGDAANVSLVVNDRAFDISAADRRGRTARLTITGP
jgi:cytoskeleton protein RodZ